MMTFPVRVPLLVLLIALLAVQGGSTSPQTTSASDYRALIARYSQGDYVTPVNELARWAPERVREQARVVEAILRENRKEGVPLHTSATARMAIESIALLHVEVLLQGRWDKEHFDRAWSALDTLGRWPNAKAFVESSCIILSSRLVYLVRPQDAQELFRGAHPTADVLLALGSISESAYARDIGFTRLRLEDAHNRFEEALRLDPSLTEARVRLGHVLLERGFPDAAIPHLERARREAPEGFLGYLSALFLGSAHEHKGAWEVAEGCYRAALHEYPEAQAAYIALGHVQHASGRADEGWRTLRGLFGDSAAPRQPQRDPWWVYFDAQSWQTGHRIDQLRAMLRP